MVAFVYRLFTLILVMLGVYMAAGTLQTVQAADTTPPTTTLNKSGTEGNDGWYVSTVDIKLRAFDLESSPASTTYQINSLPPVVNEYFTISNSILNSSFESGWLLGINNWTPVASDTALLYQAGLGKVGYRSAAVIAIGSSYNYWTNYNDYVPVVAGQNYAVSTWMRTVNVSSAPGAWFEVWALDSSGTHSDIMLTKSESITYEMDWRLIGANFTIPAGYDGVYVKLGVQTGAGIVWYDGVTMHTGSDAVTDFLLQQNGLNSVKFYSTDNAGNLEAQQEEYPIKIDTVPPQNWSEFRWNITGNNHTYTAYVDVEDVTSGIVPASAQYRWYDESNCNCWSSWTNADSVVRVDNGSSAPYGYAGMVTIKTHSSDMGNSGNHTLPKVQFRINDVASALAESPAYSLFGPWLKIIGGGDLYTHGGISTLGPVPEGQNNIDGVIVSYGEISGVASLYDWLVMPYQLAHTPIASLEDFIPHFTQMQSRATPLPENKLPSTGGVYSFAGDYTVDHNSLTTGFTDSALNAVIIIDGNMYINRNFDINQRSAVAFLVTGDVIYSSGTTRSAGFIIAAGDINTNSTTSHNSSDNSLTHVGGLIAGQDVILGRNLGKNKNHNPAETIQFPVKYLANQAFANLFFTEDASFVWQEIEL